MISHLGDVDRCLHGWHVLHGLLDDVDAACVLRFERIVALLKQPVDGGDHAHNLLLRHLHAAADSVARIVVGMRQIGQHLPSQQQSRVLRTAHSLASGECYEIETHAGVLP